MRTVRMRALLSAGCLSNLVTIFFGASFLVTKAPCAGVVVAEGWKDGDALIGLSIGGFKLDRFDVLRRRSRLAAGIGWRFVSPATGADWKTDVELNNQKPTINGLRQPLRLDFQVTSRVAVAGWPCNDRLYLDRWST